MGRLRASTSTRALIGRDVSVFGRGDALQVTGYQGGINTATGNIYIAYNSGGPNVLDFEPHNLDLSSDVLVQFDVFGEALSLYAWLPDTPKPAQPQLEVTHNALTSRSGRPIDPAQSERVRRFQSGVVRLEPC